MWVNAPAAVHAPTHPEEAGTHQRLLVLISSISPAPAALSYLGMQPRAKQLPWICSDQGLMSALQSTGEANKALLSLDLLKKLLHCVCPTALGFMCPAGATQHVWFGRCGAAWPQSWEQPQPGLQDCKCHSYTSTQGPAAVTHGTAPAQTHTQLKRELYF